MRKAMSLTLQWAGIALIAGILLFGTALAVLCDAEQNVPKTNDQSAAIVVLGAQVLPDGTPNVLLEWRLEKALEQYLLSPRLIIACGAQGDNEPLPEGEAMRNWLIAHGVPEQDVIAETNSYNTRENLKNALALLPEGAESILIVTSDYHVPRALAIAKDLGIEATGVGSPTKYWFKNHAREVLAWVEYFITK